MSTTLLQDAVYHSRVASKRGALERLFTLWFQRLVYNQIWEDPRIDLQALQIRPDSRVLTIASAGCNVLNYLMANPAEIIAVDLNPAHLALTRLKLAAAHYLPDHAGFFQMFGIAADRGNARAYDGYLRAHLDQQTRDFWEHRPPFGRRRIDHFTAGLYRRGLLGRYIGFLHRLLQLNGVDPARLLQADSLAEQRQVFESGIAPVFDKAMVRWLCSLPAALYSLGIPPAQFRALQSEVDGSLAALYRERLRRLACDFPIESNYFAWQAFGRRYGAADSDAIPEYLQSRNFELLRRRVPRVTTRLASLTALLAEAPQRSLDRYVLLDAQDWMSAGQLQRLWQQIDRTARPGARAIFRTAGSASPLEPALSADLLARWQPEQELAAALHRQDRSAIYGGFHIYSLGD